MLGEGINVGKVANEFLFEELLHDLFSQVLDVHRIFGGKIDNPAHLLLRTMLGIGTADGHFSLPLSTGVPQAGQWVGIFQGWVWVGLL